ncbi:hypothetical protein [Streptomyces sp. NPDC001076]
MGAGRAHRRRRCPAPSAATGTQLTLTACGGTGQTWTSADTGAVPAGQSQTFTYDGEGARRSPDDAALFGSR